MDKIKQMSFLRFGQSFARGFVISPDDFVIEAIFMGEMLKNWSPECRNRAHE
jgi:hypothetical protein